MRKIHYIILFIVITSISACNRYSKTESGLRFKFLKRSDKTALPALGDYLQCYYSITNSEDSIVFSIAIGIPIKSDKGDSLFNCCRFAIRMESVFSVFSALLLKK